MAGKLEDDGKDMEMFYYCLYTQSALKGLINVGYDLTTKTPKTLRFAVNCFQMKTKLNKDRR